MSDVFISYSQPDRDCAHEMVARLEAQGVKCWIAPRDIAPSADWAAEIIDAITAARVMVLIFSASSNQSPQVRREVERAVHKGVSILPFRIENVLPSKSLEFFLSSQHWMDAFPPPTRAILRTALQLPQDSPKFARDLRAAAAATSAADLRDLAHLSAAGNRGVRRPRVWQRGIAAHRGAVGRIHRPARKAPGQTCGASGDWCGGSHYASGDRIGCGARSQRIRTVLQDDARFERSRRRSAQVRTGSTAVDLNPIIRRNAELWLILGYLVLYAVGYLSKPISASAAIWPSDALSFAAFMLLPVRRWAWVAIVIIAAEFTMVPILNSITHHHQPPWTATLGFALANVLTTVGPAALSRLLHLFHRQDRWQLAISPVWIVALLVGVLPGSILGVVTRAYVSDGVPQVPADVGLWGVASVLTIVTFAPTVFGVLLGFSEPAQSSARPWESWLLSIITLALLAWFAFMPWPGVDQLVQPMLFTLPLAWLALRFSRRTTSVAVAIVAVGVVLLIEHADKLARDHWEHRWLAQCRHIDRHFPADRGRRCAAHQSADLEATGAARGTRARARSASPSMRRPWTLRRRRLAAQRRRICMTA